MRDAHGRAHIEDSHHIGSRLIQAIAPLIGQYGIDLLFKQCLSHSGLKFVMQAHVGMQYIMACRLMTQSAPG